MDSCSIKLGNLPNIPIKNTLAAEFENDTARLVSTMMYILNDDMNGFNDEFAEFYKNKYKVKTNPPFRPTKAAALNQLKEAAIDFAYSKEPHISSKSVTSGDRLTTALYNYSVPEARTEGQRHVSNIILEIFKDVKLNNISIEGNKVDWYLKKVKGKWTGCIITKVAQETNRNKAELTAEYKAAKDKRAFIDEILGGRRKSEQNQNLYAVWCELNTNKTFAVEYINDLFNDPKLYKVLDDVSRSLDELNDQDNAESNPDLNDYASSDVEDALTEPDSTVADYDHSGIKKNFGKHISDVIKLYFDTLPKLTEYNITAYDTNNYYGLATRMSWQECSQFLYSISEQFDDIASMIKAVQDAARNVPKFYAFIKFAQDLIADPSFANEIFRVFSKPKFEFAEVVVEGDKTTTRVANDRVNKESAMRLDFINDIKSSITNDYYAMRDIYNDVSKTIEQVNFFIHRVNNIDASEQIQNKVKVKLKSAKAEAIAGITRLLKLYFPSIEEDSIKAYLELNNGSTDAQFYTNCLKLQEILSSTLDNHPKSYQAYQVKLANIQAVKDHNSKLDLQKEHAPVPASEYKSDTEFRNDDYIKGQLSAIKSLVDELKPFTVGRIRLNDRNIKGNLQSAILNASWISSLKHMTDKFYIGYDANGKEVLKNNALVAWGTKKLLRGGQHRYSTLLVEQTDEAGVVLNKDKALFRIVNDTVELTENADKILKIMLFNGSSNIDDGTNMEYSKMTSGDFFPTSYMTFFSTVDNSGAKVPLASYFPKTPSDAPNTFLIQSIRHDASQLVRIKDPNKLENDINELISSTIRLIPNEEFVSYVQDPDASLQVNRVFDSDLNTKLLSSNHGIVNNSRAIKRVSPINEKGEYEAYVTYQTQSGIMFVSKGTIYKVGKKLALKNASLVGIVSVNFKAQEQYTELPTEIRNKLTNYYYRRLETHDVTVGDKVYAKTEYIIDTNNPVFKLIRNQFKQEIIDAATAVSHYFEIRKKDNGNYEVVLDKQREGIWRPHTKDGIDLNIGYDNYHRKGKSVITFNNDTNSFHLTGDVFRSLNFIINGRNFFEDIISEDTNPVREDDGTINLLYGGAMELVCDNDGRVIDVVFSEKQLEKINEALTEFLDVAISQVTENVAKNKAFIKNVPTSRAAIAEYTANNWLMQFNFDHILDASPKLYKSPQDVIKRVKQFQGSGEPYGNANYSPDFEANMEEAEHSFLNNGTISRTETVDGKKQTRDVPITEIIDSYEILRGTRQRNGFYAVTIENTKRTNTAALEVLRNKLINECGISEQHADELIYGPEEVDKKTGKKIRSKGYQGTKVNDAQSYITIQEFVRRLSAKGHLKRYLPLIDRIMDESKPVSAKDISEFVQVQKNFYFDIWYDDNYGIEVGRQIKNAEFVLIPRFIRGTQLMRVYEAMREAGIDQLNTRETSKAANERVLRIWDDNAEFDEQTIQTFISQAKEVKQIYSYNNLYTQQETPQHMDDENKASIQIMKKIMDNIPSKGHPLSQVKQDFFDTYTHNIKESQARLLKRLGVPTDENGDIEINENGAVKRYSSRVLYKRMLEEARRTGVNDNQKDYFNIPDDELGPIMPCYMNNYLTQFESVFQSMFNSNITRQKLPGFHAAQITNVGFKPYGEEEGLKVSYSKELKYHPDGKPYIEVLVPYKALGIDKNSSHYSRMDDEAILTELEEKGLLDFVGYRIPTEGKQSMAVMRIAGFIDDSLGSTIVVPDDWVSQTGSDFDIDSVYTILHEHRTKKNGEIEKIEYKTAENRTLSDWYKYVSDAVREMDNADASEQIKNSSAEAAKVAQDTFKELMEEEQSAYEALPDEDKEFVQAMQDAVKNAQKGRELSNQEAYLEQLISIADRIAATEDLDSFPELKKFMEVCNSIAEEIENYTEHISEEKTGIFEDIASDNGLLSFEEFKQAENDLEANLRKARNSHIADLFLSTLRNSASLEENLSRSNFDKITEAKASKMDKAILDERASRNPHNVCDQIAYQEEVMSGRELKGMSVALDTMCSVCNTVRPTLTEGITVVYNTDEVDVNAAKAGFDCVVDEKAKTATITHNNYGWSRNDRCVDGYILTAYSSQTTAYILDAVKEGSILNVNSFTFPVWKTLANIGCSYGVSIAFITQPGVSEIVKVHNAKNSVFTKGYGNEVNEAIKNLCKRVDPTINTNDNLASILSKINKNHSDIISKLFSVNGEAVNFAISPKTIAKLALNSHLLDARIHKTGILSNPNSIEAAIFDLGIALIYSRISNIASKIGSIARCCTPDKFGAKQNVYATRKIFDDIIKCIYKTEDIDVELDDGTITSTAISKERKPVLAVDGKHILEAIYPGVETSALVAVESNRIKDIIIKNILENGDVNASAYPPLFAFLKYSTCTSVAIAKKVFDTQKTPFVSVIEGLGQTFSGTNKEVPEEIYNDFQKYLLTTMYNNVPSIKYPVQVRVVNGQIKLSLPKAEDINDNLAREETARIWGFDKTTELSTPVEETYITRSGKERTRVVFKRFTVKDVTNPTEEELEEFEKLSPAQKVYFIQSSFPKSEIFSLLNVSLENSRSRGRYKNAQTISFLEESANPNDIFRMFKRAFESDNPLVVSAAIDIVKYAMQVEGMRTTATAVNKIIDNDCLINSFDDGTGLSFIDAMKVQMNAFGAINGTCGNGISVANTYENYLRTLPANVPIRTLSLSKSNTRKFNIYPVSYNIYCVKADAVSENPDENLAEFNKKLTRMGIKYATISDEQYGLNQYIQLRVPGQEAMLYKIHDLGNQVILTPLTKLEQGENSIWSANPANNTGGYISPDAYTRLVNSYRMIATDREFTATYVRKEIASIKKSSEQADQVAYTESKNIKKPSNPAFNIEQLVKEDRGAAVSLKSTIVKHFSGIATEPLFVNNTLISENIYTPGVKYGSVQSITFPTGDVHRYNLYIPNNIRELEEAYLRPKKGEEKADISTIPFRSAREIIGNAQSAGRKFLGDMAIVAPIQEVATTEELDEVNYSTLEDAVVDIMGVNTAITANAGQHVRLVEFGDQFKNNLYVNEITPDAESVKNNLLTATENTAAYVAQASKYIREEIFDRFVEDPENEDGYIKITDPRIKDMIGKNANLMDKYMQAVNMAKALEDRVRNITHEHSDDPQIQGYIEDIKRALDKNLGDIPIEQLLRDGGNTFIKAKSTNPLVRYQFLDVMDGFWKTYGSMWQYFSVMENGTPILQTILSDVMVNIDAKKRLKHKMLKKYRRDIDDIIERAKSRGEDIDIHKLIDDNGNFVSEYTPEFKEKLDALRDEVKKYPRGSIEHLEAKYALDKFLLEHVNREAVDQYYESRLTIERELLDNIPELYSEYMKLYYRKTEILDYAETDELTDELKNELTIINGRMNNMYLEDYYMDVNGELQPRPLYIPNKPYTPEEAKHIKLYSKQAAKFLEESLKAIRKLEAETFEKVENLGFRRTLKANLKLIRQLERRVNGIPTVSQDILLQNPDYVKAVNWIRNNAYFQLTTPPEGPDEGMVANDDTGENFTDKDDYLVSRIYRAFKYLGRNKKNKIKGFLTGLLKNNPERAREITDVRGVIDGRKLSANERESIKHNNILNGLPDPSKTINDSYAPDDPNHNGKIIYLGSRPLIIDRMLISNRKPDGTTFSMLFYKKLGEGFTAKSTEYYKIVAELNKLLEPLLGAVDGYIHFERIKDNAEGIALLNKIADLYNALSQYRGTDYNENGERNGTGVSDFVKKHVEFVTNTELFQQQVKDLIAKKASDAFNEAMLRIFYLTNANGEYIKDSETGDFVPNRFLYSYAKPKGNPGEHSYDQWVSKAEQEARALIDKYYENVPTEYYEYAKEEAIANGTYEEWYNENHYYNPFTRKMQPISCWMTPRIKTEMFADSNLDGEWLPKSRQARRKVKDGKYHTLVDGKLEEVIDPDEDMTNHNYKPNEGYAANYKVGSGYDTAVRLNQGEAEMLTYLKETLKATAKTNKAKRFFKQGKVPRQAKSTDGVGKTILKNVGKSIGIGLTENNGYSNFREEIGYEYDEEVAMPMMAELNNKVTAELERKLKQLKQDAPVQEDGETTEAFNDRVAKYEEDVNEITEQLKKERASITDTNWYDAIENYLSLAADYNAVQDNKNKLYFLLNVLKDMKMYSRKHGSYGDLKTQRTNADGTKVYQTSTDKKLIEQYENFLRRLLFDEWKEAEGFMTTLGNFLQGFTSSNYMMLNVRGGIANVNLGETGILAEAAAKDFIGHKDWGFGTWEYTKGITSYTASAWHYATHGKKRYFSKQDAIIGEFNVVDYDEVTGVIRNTNLNHYAEQLRNFMFSPQTMGEHFMQNSVLFAVLHSHRIFDTEQGVIAMSKEQYIAYKQAELLREVLNEEQLEKFEEYKNKIKADKDELAKHAWFRREAITRFVYIHCTREQRNEFNKLRKEQRKRFEQEFDAKEDIYSQLELTEDGELGFKAGSEMERLNSIKADALEMNMVGAISEAQQLMSKIAEKTRKINNKIHGIYNRIEAAHIESKWYGSLVMQYHKHIPMGLMKRYMARGHWNEFRGSVDKGMVHSIFDILALNVEKVQHDCGFSREEATALKSFMFNFTHAFKMLTQLQQTWEMVPQYDKANLYRNLGDLFGVVSAIGTTAALWALAEDDDPEGFMFNLLLYEADRLASEAFMWNPYGMIVEGKKLMSTPIAAGSVINDAVNLLVLIYNWIFDSDFNPYYESGRFAGEHKAWVYVQRRIPIWNGIRNFIDVADNNRYYKVAANPIGLFDVKKLVRGEE